MARDNFNKSVIEELKARVANRCSNPGCRVPTSGPKEGLGVNNIGIAAHISAASAGGPRYDELITTEERRSLSNGIWLCSNCSIDIDRDEKRYSVDSLNAWKFKAEKTARSELGKTLPSNSAAIDTVTAALGGFPKNYISNAISNVHQASERSLESLDSRFKVKTICNEQGVLIKLSAEEDISLIMNIHDEFSESFKEKHQNFFNNGTDIEIESAAIKIKGSPLIEEIFKQNYGVVSFVSKKIEATQKTWLVEEETGLVESFDDIQGVISFGSKSMRFSGEACNGIFNFIQEKSISAESDSGKILLSVNFQQWEGNNVVSLPYFNKLLSFFSKMSKGWNVFTSLEVDGERLFESIGQKFNKLEFVLDVSSFLNYVSRGRVISKMLMCEILFTEKFSYTAEENKKISDVVEILKGEYVYGKNNLKKDITSELRITDYENFLKLIRTTEPVSIRIVEDDGDEISVFGKNIRLPGKYIDLDSILPKISKDALTLNVGDLVDVEWVPQENFKYSKKYEIE